MKTYPQVPKARSYIILLLLKSGPQIFKFLVWFEKQINIYNDGISKT